MPLEEKLQKQVKTAKLIKDLGPDEVQNLVNQHLRMNTPNLSNAQLTPASYDSSINPDPNIDVPLSNPQEASPFDQSQLGQWYNQPSDDDNRPVSEKLQDIANENIARTFPNSDKNTQNIQEAKDLVQKQNSQIPSESINKIIGPDLTKLTNPNAGIQVPMRPEELAALPSDTSNDRTADSDAQEEKDLNPNIPTIKTGVGTKSINSPQSAKSEEQKIIDTAISSPPNSADEFNKQLEDARQKDQQHQLLFGMLKAAQMGGSALAGSKADTSFADQELAKQNQNVTNLKTSMDMKEEAANIEEKKQKRDPNSKISKLYQDMLRELNPNMKVDGLSAEQVDRIYPQIGAIINKREATEARLAVAKENALNRAHLSQMRKLDLQDKLDQQDKESAYKVLEKADMEKARVNTPAGREEAKINAGAHAMQLLNDYAGKEDKMPPYALHALAMDYATLQSPGAPTEHTIKEMGIDTFEGDAGKILSKITGKSYGAGAKGFAESIKGNIQSQIERSKKLQQIEMDRIVKDNAMHFRNPGTINILKNSLSDRYTKDLSSKENIKESLPLTSPLPAGRSFTDKSTGKKYKVNPDGKSATEI